MKASEAMKKVIYLLLTASFIGAILFSCENDRRILVGSITSHSECKSSKAAMTADVTSDTLSCISYLYDASAKKLSITHINAGFNCCPGRLWIESSIESNTVIISEFERAAQCDCNCLFDLNIEIYGLESKTYQVKFKEPYSGDEPHLIFEMDLLNNPEGSFCVTRKHYPWGMSQLR